MQYSLYQPNISDYRRLITSKTRTINVKNTTTNVSMRGGIFIPLTKNTMFNSASETVAKNLKSPSKFFNLSMDNAVR